MNRSELLFLYDVTDSNPNGDPMDENKPRLDEETGVNLVTDVRLKRTIRDYLNEAKGKEIFVKEIRDEHDKLQDAKLRAEDFLFDEQRNKLDKNKISMAEMKSIIGNNVLQECIDVRLFGATIPLEREKEKKPGKGSEKEGGSLTYTGPVQFKIGRSLHAVNMLHVKGTGAFAADKNKTQSTFREEYFLSYSLIGFYGIINENAAVHTALTEDDVDLLLEAMWKGTKNLISRSKVGQMPRLLLRVVYKEKDYHIGELDKYISLKKCDERLRDEDLRDITQCRIDVTELFDKLFAQRDKVDRVEYALDARTTLIKGGKVYNPAEAVDGVQFIALPFNDQLRT
mgnify:CR=1 FL=1